MFIFNCEQTRQIEQAAVNHGCTYFDLMEQAGSRAAEFILFLKDKLPVTLEKIVILCGKGNNGGDGFVVARKLCEWGASVTVVLMDGLPTTTSAKTMFSLIKKKVTAILDYSDQNVKPCIAAADLVVDAIYGIGFKGKLREHLEPIVDFVAQSDAKVLSLDLPSGVQCDGGEVEGKCISADCTVTFTALKPAHVLYPAADYCGEVVVASVGILPEIVNASPYVMQITDKSMVKQWIPVRKQSAHKGDFGRLLCVCGSAGMAGAAVLASSAAVRCGAGLVDVALPKSIYPIVAGHISEPIFTLLHENEKGTLSVLCKDDLLHSLNKADVCLFGCGIGCSEDIDTLTVQILQSGKGPLIIDADGINAIVAHIDILKQKAAEIPIALTPHPGEMARLLHTSIADVQQHRYEYVHKFAMEHRVIVVLKGANTLIGLPDGRVFANRTGNPGMARGGSGDVLAGMIASFAAQGISLEKAVLCGVYLHGLAGDRCAQKYSQISMIPSDMVLELPTLFLDIFNSKD